MVLDVIAIEVIKAAVFCTRHQSACQTDVKPLFVTTSKMRFYPCS